MTAPVSSSPNMAADLADRVQANACQIAPNRYYLPLISKDERDLIVSALRSTPAPAPAPHGGDREAIARIIEPGIFAHDGSGSMVEFMGRTRREEALAKADAILALRPASADNGWREPTDADVERVAVAIEKTMFAPHEFPLSEELHGRYLVTARAAITSYHSNSEGQS